MKDKKRINLFSISIATVWICSIMISFMYNTNNVTKKQKLMVVEHAKNAFEKDLMFRKWIAMHGGVYVFPTKQTPPNPYLAHIPNRDLKTISGKELTLMNPAYVLRELMENFSGMYGEKGHITSLKLLNPKNKPDAWETKVLKKFDKKKLTEFHEIYNYNGKEHLRYMKALITKPDCLRCHIHQGYKVGDVRGGVSITIPMKKYNNDSVIEKEDIFYLHLTILIFSLLLGFIIYKKVLLTVKREIIIEQELVKSNKKLEKHKEDLESIVLQRTQELEYSNEELQVSIDNLKQAQNHLVQTEKMASLGGLVAGVAHEINTPIGLGITSTTHFLTLTQKLKKLYENEQMSQEDFEDYIKNASQLAQITYENLKRSAELVKSFKQISMDQTNEQKRKFNLKEYVKDTLLSLHNKIKHTKIKVELKCDANINIYSYAGRCSQIITNLIMNSLIHGYDDDNGTINLNFKVRNSILYFRYKDDGKGISKENLNKIFDPFFTTNREKGGSGLGLNIIYNIITQQLNGTIECSSEEGKGVEFIMIIPIIENEEI